VRKYKVTCIRVRLPDGHILQGRFAASEPVSSVFEFVRQCLSDASVPIVLRTAQGAKLDASSGEQLASAQLVPAALLHLSAADATLSEALLAIREALP
jgi:hypothetical protein